MANSVTDMAGDAPPAQPAPAKRAGRKLSPDVLGWLQAAPLSVVMIGFLLAPIVMIVIVSFWIHSLNIYLKMRKMIRRLFTTSL